MNYRTFQNFHDTPKIIILIKPDLGSNRLVTESSIQNTSFSFLESPNTTFLPHTVQDKQSDIKVLSSMNTIDELLDFSKEKLVWKYQSLSKRLLELIELYDEDDLSISVDSLKSMLVFILIIPNEFTMPTLTLNENGTFQLNWRKNNSSLITLRFKNENSLDYVIFKPSQHGVRPIILNGNMNLFDFIEYLEDLNLYKMIKGLN